MQKNEPDPECTPEQAAEVDLVFALYKHVSAYREERGDPWGGPPYTEAELAYARRQLGLEP
jgi:hypothetical protein